MDEQPDPGWRRWLIVIGAGAFLLRLGFLLLPGQLAAALDADSDPYYYHLFARHLREAGEFRAIAARAYQPPGYPAYLAALYSLNGESLALARLSLAVLSSLQCVLTTVWARALSTTNVGLIAGALCALDPQLIRYPQTLMSEPLFMFLQALGLAILVKAVSSRGLGGHALSGFVFGLATLTREVAILTPVAVAAWYLLDKGLQIRRWQAWAVFTAVMGLTIVPWTVRNYVVFDALVPVTTNGGVNFYIGNHPGASGDFEWVIAPGVDWQRGAGELEAHRQGLRAGLGFIREYPSEAAGLLLRKLWVLWRPPALATTRDGRAERVQRFVWLSFYSLSGLLAILGLLWSRSSWRRFALPLGLILLPTLLHVVVVSSSRYRLPMVPMVLFCSALGVAAIARVLVSPRAAEG